ncbi:MAG: ATPase domain [Pseudomonadota bacterium]
MAVNPLLIQALKRLNPSAPAGPEDFIDREWEGMARGWDVCERLTTLLAAGFTVRAVLHGPIGVGKTTELRRWARELEGIAAVVQVVAPRPSNEVPPYQESARQVAGFLEDALAQHVGWDWRDVQSATDADPDRSSLSVLLSRAFQDADPALPKLLLIDALDLLTNEQDQIFGAAQNLPLDELPSVVFVGAHPWFLLTPRERRDPRLEYIWELPCFAVQDPDGRPNPLAIEALAKGLQRRLGPTEGAFWDLHACCETAAYISGGVPRDAIRVLHAAVLSAAKAGQVNAAHLNIGVNELRQDIAQSLSSAELARVAEVGRTLNHQGDASLISKNAILPYDLPDRRYWLPHPVLLNLLPPPKGR